MKDVGHDTEILLLDSLLPKKQLSLLKISSSKWHMCSHRNACTESGILFHPITKGWWLLSCFSSLTQWLGPTHCMLHLIYTGQRTVKFLLLVWVRTQSSLPFTAVSTSLSHTSLLTMHFPWLNISTSLGGPWPASQGGLKIGLNNA